MKIRKKDILINVLSILTLISVILFWESILFLTFLLTIIGILIIIILKDKKNIIIYIICGLFGAITEIIAVKFGIWSYTNSNFLSIPIWLIPLWGNATLFMINFSKEIEYYIKQIIQ